MDRLAIVPGVDSVASTSNLPPRYANPVQFHIIGQSDDGQNAPQTQYHEISPGYFHTMSIPVLRGRQFTDRDNENGPGVAIVSESFARQYFGGDDPIGRSLLMDLNAQNRALEGDRVREIVGVAGDVRMDFHDPFIPIVYVPYRQSLKEYAGFAPFFIRAIRGFVIRTSGNPEQLVQEMRRAFADVDPAVAVTTIMPMQERLASGAGISAGALDQQYWMRLLGIFAGIGVFLAAIGVYGVISYTVEQRAQEFGIRAAFGAEQNDILRIVLREGILVLTTGLLLGVAGAFAATPLIAKKLFDIKPMDPATIAAVGIVLVVTALLACCIPAKRATKLDPLSVLRTE